MTFRKPTRLDRLQPQRDSIRFCNSLVGERGPRIRGRDWREAARSLARQLMPLMVLVAAAVLGLAAVAMA